MKWFIIGLVLGTINWIIIKKFVKIRIQYFKPITHHGGILEILPGCMICLDKIKGFGIQTGSRFPFHNYYHTLCWLKQLLPRDRK